MYLCYPILATNKVHGKSWLLVTALLDEGGGLFKMCHVQLFQVEWGDCFANIGSSFF
jgi:hypothetical protein